MFSRVVQIVLHTGYLYQPRRSLILRRFQVARGVLRDWIFNRRSHRFFIKETKRFVLNTSCIQSRQHLLSIPYYWYFLSAVNLFILQLNHRRRKNTALLNVGKSKFPVTLQDQNLHMICWNVVESDTIGDIPS